MTEVAPVGIHITRWGNAGPQVVMIHGGVQGSAAAGERNFRAQKELGDEGWRLIVPDRPGHGQSPAPDRGDDAEADAVWAAELLDEPTHLVGHSFGGLVALSAAALRPDMVRSLVLIEPGAHKLATRVPAVRRFLLRMALAVYGSFRASTRAERVMKILAIPAPEFGRDDDQLKRMGRALTRGKFPARKTIERNLATVASSGIPLLVVSGGWSEAFVATGEITAAAGGGTHIISPSEHHFPQWYGDRLNPQLTAFWRAADDATSSVI